MSMLLREAVAWLSLQCDLVPVEHDSFCERRYHVDGRGTFTCALWDDHELECRRANELFAFPSLKNSTLFGDLQKLCRLIEKHADDCKDSSCRLVVNEYGTRECELAMCARWLCEAVLRRGLEWTT